MKKLRREYLLIAAVLLVLLIITGAAGLFQGKAEKVPPLSSNSNTADGTRALRLWLSATGYTVSNQSAAQFQVPQGSGAVLILEPDNIAAAQWETLDTWLESGGTLLIAAQNLWMDLSASPLDLDASFFFQRDYPAYPVAPLFAAPPAQQPAKLTYEVLLQPKDAQYQPLLSTAEGVIALRLKRKQGSIILIADSSFLTNHGLKDPGNAALALNLFALIPKDSHVWIDEWHHGERGSAAEQGYGPEAWLTGTPAGFAVLFSALIVFIGLLLAGRPFGRPVPLPQEQQRRTALEYVTALANLNRRAGHHRALLQYYHSAVKRAYGKRYRLDPSLPDAAYVDQLILYNPALDGPALRELLQRLEQRNVNDAQVVHLAREAAGWLSRLERG